MQRASVWAELGQRSNFLAGITAAQFPSTVSTPRLKIKMSYGYLYTLSDYSTKATFWDPCIDYIRNKMCRPRFERLYELSVLSRTLTEIVIRWQINTFKYPAHKLLSWLIENLQRLQNTICPNIELKSGKRRHTSHFTIPCSKVFRVWRSRHWLLHGSFLKLLPYKKRCDEYCHWNLQTLVVNSQLVKSLQIRRK